MKNEDWIPVTGGWIHPQTCRDVMQQTLTVAMLRRCKRELEIQADIEAFERWRDTPSIEEAIIRDRVAYLIFRQENPAIANSLDIIQHLREWADDETSH